MAINILDTKLTNLISAGEVIERPASIVKELIDNSIDAKATKIEIEIKSGGIDYISVRDNGLGIDECDIKKAFLPHATSKISTADDLDNIFTLGFRGEALASIASVSKVNVVSKTNEAVYATSLEVDGGVFGEVKAEAGNNGTFMEVRNLFYNTPVRRKFLKKPSLEEAEISNIIARYILAHPTINFKFISNGKIVYQSVGNSLLDAIFCVYGKDTAQSVMPFSISKDDINIYGYVSKVSFSKPNTSYQTLLVNGRYVIDETISKAVYFAFEDYLMTRQFPFFVMNIDMPYKDVDVNVHPNKMNVKFADINKLYEMVFSACRESIYNCVNPKSQPINTTTDTSKENINVPQQKTYAYQNEEQNINKNLQKTELNAQNAIINQDDSFDVKNDNILAKNNEVLFDMPEDKIIEEEILPNKNESSVEEPLSFSSSLKLSQSFNNVSMFESENNEVYNPISNFAEYKVIGELFSEFLVLEKDDNMILLDFHAGHERLLYDKFTKQMENKELAIQDLLVPYIQQLNDKEMSLILSLKDDISALGFDIDQFSPTEIRISAVPMSLKDINLKNFVNDILNDVNAIKPKMNYEIKHYLAQKACKSAVKAGMTLNDTQIHELLKNIDMKKPVLLCPHGRPIISVISRAQIEKWFKRIV